MSGIHIRYGVSPDQFLCALTRAVYDVVLNHGFAIPFIEVELELYKALSKVLEDEVLVSEACGSPACLKNRHFPMGTAEADEIFPDSSEVSQTP